MARILTITSGKGGVGKTSISANLGIQLASMGYRTCVFDADLGLANINIVLGLYPEYTIEDVLSKHKSLSDIIIRNHEGIDIVPGSTGVEKIANMPPDEIDALISGFSALDVYDFIIFDTSAGVSKNVVSFCLASTELVLIITPEPTSLTDAYALLKILTANGLAASVKVIINQCKNTAVAKQTYGRFKEVVKKYLALDILPLGVVLQDANVSHAVSVQQACVSRFPDTIATKCIRVIASNLLQHTPEIFAPAGAETFFNRFVGYFKSSLRLKDVQDVASAVAASQSPARPASASAHVDDRQHQETQPLHKAPDTAAYATVYPQAGILPDAAVSRPESPDNAVPLPVYAELAAALSAISRELRLLRIAVESGSSSIPAANASRLYQQTSPHQPEASDSVVLDFEHFLRRRLQNDHS